MRHAWHSAESARIRREMADILRGPGTVLDQRQLPVLTRLFSPTVFRDFATNGRSRLYSSVAKQSELLGSLSPESSVADTFETAFSVLGTAGNRDEYIYRSAITQKILLGRHSLRTASIVNEVRAGSSKADVVILNGTSTAYEIKSERDSIARLPGQLDSYLKVFASVNVVTSSSHLDGVLRIAPKDVGVMVLSPRFTISVVRDALDAPARIDPCMVLDSIRLPEARSILTSLGIDFPEVPNTLVRAALREIFKDIDPVTLHRETVRCLKKTRSQSTSAAFVDQLPRSLKAMALSTRVGPAARIKIQEALSTPLSAALTWK